MGETPHPMDRICFWNTNGLNKPHKQNEMNLFMNNQRVGLFVLLETKIKRAKAQQATLNLYRGWSFTINLVKHPAGRIWIVWKPEVYVVNITNVTEQLIHRKVHHRGTWNKFNIIIVYGFNNQSMIRQLWKDIKNIYQ